MTQEEFDKRSKTKSKDFKLTPLSIISNHFTDQCRPRDARIRDLIHEPFDFYVWLPTMGRYLQRGLVWSLEQKQEFIRSYILNKPILPATIHKCYPRDDVNWTTCEVIDGKQRLTTVLAFYYNQFPALFDGYEIYYNDLPKDYKDAFDRREFPITQMTRIDKGLSDKEKVDWFNSINFKGVGHEDN